MCSFCVHGHLGLCARLQVELTSVCVCICVSVDGSLCPHVCGGVGACLGVHLCELYCMYVCALWLRSQEA